MPNVKLPGGTVSASVEIEPGPLMQLVDGSYMQSVTVMINGARRNRSLRISADGLSFAIDGVPVASPPAALNLLGSATVTYATRRDAALTAPGVLGLLTAQ